MSWTRGVALVVAGLVALGAAPAVGRAQQPSEPAAAGPQRIALTVTGLSCPFCAYGLEKKLRKLEAVDSIHIEFQQGRVVLDVRDGSKLSDERLRQAVRDGGFSVERIERARLPAAPSKP